MEQEQLEADIIAYSTVISSCAKSGQWEQALMFLGAMQASREFSKFFHFPAIVCVCLCVCVQLIVFPHWALGEA